MQAQQLLQTLSFALNHTSI